MEFDNSVHTVEYGSQLSSSSWHRESVRSEDGEDVGCLVNIKVGTALGPALGAVVGAVAGDTIGLAVGCAVGATDGGAVGRGDGDAVCMSTHTRSEVSVGGSD